MQTALHILSLVAEMKRELIGGRIVNTEFYKKERAAYLFVKSESGLWAVACVFHPAGSGYFLIPGSKVKVETREKPWPIFDLTGATITGVEQPSLDRLCYLSLEKDGQSSYLVIEALGPNGNLWLLDSHHGKKATLRNRDFTQGDTYSIVPVAGKLHPETLTNDLLATALAEQVDTAGDIPFALFVEKKILGFNKTLSREATFRIGAADFDVNEIEERQLEKFVGTAMEMVTRFAAPDSGYLYSVGGTPEAYPMKLSSQDEQPEKFKSLSFAVMTGAMRRQDTSDEQDDRKIVNDLVASSIRKLERRIQKLEQDITEAQDFERYKRLGELLQINFDKLRRGMTSIEMEDVIADTSQRVVIPLEQALAPQENIEAYFRRYRKGREGLDLLQRRLEITQGELAELREMANALDRNYEQAVERYKAELDSLRPRIGSSSAVPAPRLPYKPYHLSTGLTIFVGRDGADNDRTTFEFAKPFELWFHAQQCPGSHVVMKFPNKSFEPSKAEIEETASIAAFFSRAKNDSLVPVIYTERRYVRKPSKAKPGLVVVEREKSVMVEPTKPSESSRVSKD